MYTSTSVLKGTSFSVVVLEVLGNTLVDTMLSISVDAAAVKMQFRIIATFLPMGPTYIFIC